MHGIVMEGETVMMVVGSQAVALHEPLRLRLADSCNAGNNGRPQKGSWIDVLEGNVFGGCVGEGWVILWMILF